MLRGISVIVKRMNYLILELEIFKIPACPAVSVRYCEYLADILSTLVDF